MNSTLQSKRPKYEDFDYGKGREDLSKFQYTKALEEYIDYLESKNDIDKIYSREEMKQIVRYVMKASGYTDQTISKLEDGVLKRIDALMALDEIIVK